MSKKLSTVINSAIKVSTQQQILNDLKEQDPYKKR